MNIKFVVLTDKNYHDYKDLLYKFELTLYDHQKALYKGYFPEFQFNTIKDKHANIVIFQDKDKPFGYIIYKIFNKLWVTELYFNEDYRGKGLLKQVVKYLVNICTKKKIPTIALGALNTNKSAIISYTACGFVITSVNVDSCVLELPIEFYNRRKQ
jgi:Acetyltransferase (GNAT) family.